MTEDEVKIREHLARGRVETWAMTAAGQMLTMTGDSDVGGYRLYGFEYEIPGSPADYTPVHVEAPLEDDEAALERWNIAAAADPRKDDRTRVEMMVGAVRRTPDEGVAGFGTHYVLGHGYRVDLRLDAEGRIEAAIGNEVVRPVRIVFSTREGDGWRHFSTPAEHPFARAVVRRQAGQRTADDIVPAVRETGLIPSSLHRMIGDTPAVEYGALEGRRLRREGLKKALKFRPKSTLVDDGPVEVLVRLDEETRSGLLRKRQGQFVFAFHEGEARGSEADLVLLAFDALQALDTDAHKSILVFIADAIERGGRACLDARLLKHVRLAKKKASAEQMRRFEEHALLAQRLGYEVEKANGKDWRRGVFFVASEWMRDGTPTRFDLAARMLEEVSAKKGRGIPFPVSLVRLDSKRHDWTYRLALVVCSRFALGLVQKQKQAVERGEPEVWRDRTRCLGDLLIQAGVFNGEKIIKNEGVPYFRKKVEAAFGTLRDGWPDLDGTAEPILASFSIDWRDDPLTSSVDWTASPFLRRLNVDRRPSLVRTLLKPPPALESRPAE
jgi:hypothetical protein